MLSLFENLRTINDPELLLAKEPYIESDMPFHVYWKDLDGVYLGANDAQAKVCGLTKGQDTIGGSVHDFFLADSAQSFHRNDQRVIKEGSAKIFVEPVHTAGKIKRTAFSHKKTLLSKSNKVIGSLGFSFFLEDSDIMDLSFLLDPLVKQSVPSGFANKLSRRQIECLVFLIKGRTFKQIAQELDLSSRTIEHYIQTLKTKLSVYSRSELITKGLELAEIRERL